MRAGIGWVLAAVLATIAVAQPPAPPGGAGAAKPAAYGDPAVFAREIAKFAAQDLAQPPPAGAIVCTGSSSIRLWHPTLAQDLAPLTVIPRGFGGSTMNDALHYVDRLVLAYRPRAVVLYAGDNDLAQGIAPDAVAAKFRELVAAIHAKLPAARLYFLAIKPSPARWHLWPEAQRANRLIERQCEGDERLAYVDVAAPLLDPGGRPRPEFYQDDRLHLNRRGYEAWRAVLKPLLERRELGHEAGAGGRTN